MKGFSPIRSDTGAVPPHEYQPVSAIIPKVGMALKWENGKLATAGNDDTPSFISMCERESACEDGESIPVIRVLDSLTFETECSADSTSVNLGDKVQLDAGGMGVNATATGHAEVVYKDGTAAGSTVWVRFPEA